VSLVSPVFLDPLAWTGLRVNRVRQAYLGRRGFLALRVFLALKGCLGVTEGMAYPAGTGCKDQKAIADRQVRKGHRATWDRPVSMACRESQENRAKWACKVLVARKVIVVTQGPEVVWAHKASEAVEDRPVRGAVMAREENRAYRACKV
jgi:hypothetical protein